MSPLGEARGSHTAVDFEDGTEVRHQRTGNIEQPDDRVKTKTHPRGLPFLMDGDMLWVTNKHHSTTYVFEWNRKVYVIAPGERKVVLFEALVDKLGDPRSREDEIQNYKSESDHTGRGVVMQRSYELERLFTRYGVHLSNLDDIRDSKGEHRPGLLSLTPHVEVETLNRERVVFPATRPDADAFPVQPIEGKVRTDNTGAIDKLEAENAEMRDNIAALTERLDSMAREREGVD